MTFRGGRSPRTASAAVFLTAFMAGCYTPGYNSYSTARTIPPRGVAADLHAQVTGHSGEVDGVRDAQFAPFPPGFALRLGLAERLDAGAHAGLGTHFEAGLGGDVKWLVLPGDALDLALDPGLEYADINNTDIGATPDDAVSVPAQHKFWHVRAPLVTGLNFSREVVVVLTSGFVYGWPTPGFALSTADRGRLVDGIAPLVGLGVNFRTAHNIAFHPEATFVFSTGENERRVIYTLGFALQLGRLPSTLRSWQVRPAPHPSEPREPGE